MIRQIYVWRNGQMIPIEEAPPLKPESKSPYVIDDTMQNLQHPCDGNFYNSKSTFRKITRAHGGVEVGNDLLKDTRKFEVPGLKEEIRKVFDQLNK